MSAEDAMRAALSSRTLGEVLPISIATALAIESLLGENPDAPDPKAKLDMFDSLYINVRTLVRNLLGAIQTEDKNISISPKIVLEYIINEMNTIVQLMQDEVSDKVVVFYNPSYNDVFKDKFQHGILKQYKTKQQSYQYERELYVHGAIEKELKSQESKLIFIETNTTLPQDKVSVAILTHYPIDLLSRYQFKDLYLIESHTGALKAHGEWHTKLTGHKDRPPMPFDKAMLQVFGDGVLFMAAKTKLRKTMVEIAIANKWTYRTTEELVKFSAAKLNDPFFTTYVNELYSK